MKAFELRLAEHHNRNATHLKHLKEFAQDTWRFSRIKAEERQLIQAQIAQMEGLNAVLEERMRLHNIPI